MTALNTMAKLHKEHLRMNAQKGQRTRRHRKSEYDLVKRTCTVARLRLRGGKKVVTLTRLELATLE